MRPEELKELLKATKSGETTVDEALLTLRRLPVEDLGFARLDTHRELRQGLPEAIYAEGKEASEVVAIAERLLERNSSPVLVTRTPELTADALVQKFPDARHHSRSRLVVLGGARIAPSKPRLGLVTVVSGGTSDLAVSEEAAVTAETFGAEVQRITDVGVAGVHRVLAVQEKLQRSDVIIVVAGMEGALASLVGGIAAAPVVAVPTSVGYGASFEGLAALLAMLNSCAAGVVVTNIDNGFGAGVFALRLLMNRAER
ncbi:MAG: pyridinium-3,5-biscarboxylic acid mononucleotide synthase [Actinomycetota bacterium]|jgi:NCAIR mutase (PurE)-related protein|nr:pyridinium-3,5-biscarboxylic acid mononucleotide synthase [Actinomycetota bacterium]